MRYLVFSGEVDSPKGGVDDITLATDSLEEAISLTKRGKWCQVLDTENMIVVVRSGTPFADGDLMAYTAGAIVMMQGLN